MTSRVPQTQTELHSWVSRGALAFVLVTLVALVALPVLIQQRVEGMRAEIESMEPARTLVNQLQYNLARQMSALNEILLGGGDAARARLAAAWAAEDSVYAELEPFVDRLGGDVLQRFAEARALATEWHERVMVMELIESPRAEIEAAAFPRERRLFETVLTATDALDEAILEESGRVRSEIIVAQRVGLRVSVLLGVLALAAAVAAAALEARVRRFAREAEQRRLMAEEALSELARADEARARLLRGITHDVKNPLGAAKGYAELLALGIRGPISPDQRVLVDGVQRSIDGALGIISDLLDVARADSGGLRVRRLPVSLADVVRSAAEDHRAAAEAAGHILELELPDAELRVDTDPTRARQVLDNLLSNAVKYTPAPGRICIEARPAGDGAGPREGRWAAIRVIDDGPGIPPDLREAIFDEFTRIEEGGKMKGHGLGLAIARRIARMLDGELVVDDHQGPGSSFTLWLPLASS